jgi:hypothetical protein
MQEHLLSVYLCLLQPRLCAAELQGGPFAFDQILIHSALQTHNHLILERRSRTA